MRDICVIVGGGPAGHSAAVELRRLAADARIILIGDEAELPYYRPALSKDYLLGERVIADHALADAKNYAGLGIDHRASARVVALDRVAARVELADGTTVPYDRLLLATGSRPRTLGSGRVDPERLHVLRSAADAERLRAALRSSAHVAVIGGGFVGLEIAAAARSRGVAVSVFESSERLLVRTSPVEISDWLRMLHENEGAVLRLRQSVVSIEDRPAGLRIHTDNGSAVDADIAVIGIGIIPNTELAQAAGLLVDDGIVVDSYCRTLDPAVFAAGEVTSHPSPHSGKRRRVESWRTSLEQGKAAALNMVGQETAFTEPPWFWSDQFTVNLQSIGFPLESVRQVRIDAARADAFSLIALDAENRIAGATAINDGRTISILRRHMRDGADLPPSLAERLDL